MDSVIIVITQHPPDLNGLYDQSSIMTLNKCSDNSQILIILPLNCQSQSVRQNKDVHRDLGMSSTFSGPTLLNVYLSAQTMLLIHYLPLNKTLIYCKQHYQQCKTTILSVMPQ